MVTHEIAVSFTLTPGRVRLCLLAALCTFLPRLSSTADVSTMELYFPPPVAAVDQLQVRGESILARDYGNVYLGPGNGGGDHPVAYTAIGAGPNPAPLPNRNIGLYVAGKLRMDGCISLSWAGNTTKNHLWRCKF